VTVGDRLHVTLVNHLPVSTTIHWHGVPDLPNADDGVAGITQEAVAPGHTMDYDFVLTQPGTYWYHSHQDTGTQLSLGLFGALVVEPKGGPTETRDDTVVLHTPVSGTGVAMNGTTDLRLAASPGDTVRLRLIDAVVPGMDGTPEAPVLLGAPYRVVALDGRPLDGPGLLGPERLPMGMGQRVDLVFTMPAGHAVRLVDTEEYGSVTPIQQLFTAGQTPVKGTVTIGSGEPPVAVNDPSRLPLFDLTTYGTPAADPIAAGPFDLTAPIVLAEQPGFHDGTIQLVHTINGKASPAVPSITVHEGEVVRLHIVNDTGEYHPMHLHGHTMSVIGRDGTPLQGSPVHLDTILIGPHQTWDVAFLADNPGIWMFHCHVLLHAAMGMMMTINYAGVTTPYTMGSRSGNIPE
jgi:FtsP/CotA-like multicopper oxidase with cupredoxin domain